ncbi:MAG: hypothetical protein K2O39_03855, partial [Clostridiales bacterium]|nr:hypothetical protein [Clostridiales bacterium]
MKKILFVILLVCVLTFAFVACDEIDLPVNEHQHLFSDKWTYDENNHWHAATCEHSDEVDGKSAHDLHSVPGDKWRKECLTCGYSFTIQHEHTLATVYSANEHGHWLDTTCGCDYENFAPHGFVDGICTTCGWWSSATDVLFANLSKSDVFNYTVLLDNVYVNAVNLLDDEPQPTELKVSGELQLSLSADGQIEGFGYFQTDELFLKAVVSGETLYACGNGKYFRCPLSEALTQVGIDVDELCSYVDQINANTQQIREYVDQIKQTVKELPIDGLITDAMNSLVKVDETKSTDNLTVYVVDYDVLRDVNETLSTVTVEQYVNALLAQLDGTPLG